MGNEINEVWLRGNGVKRWTVLLRGNGVKRSTVLLRGNGVNRRTVLFSGNGVKRRTVLLRGNGVKPWTILLKENGVKRRAGNCDTFTFCFNSGFDSPASVPATFAFLKSLILGYGNYEVQ